MIVTTMVVILLGDIAKASAVTVILAAFGCIVAAGFAVPMSMGPGQPAAEAFWLAKSMAMLGGIALLAFMATATCFFWLTGQASEKAFVLIELADVGLAIAFVVTVAALLDSARKKA
jgi:hypothetical protein